MEFTYVSAMERKDITQSHRIKAGTPSNLCLGAAVRNSTLFLAHPRNGNKGSASKNTGNQRMWTWSRVNRLRNKRLQIDPICSPQYCHPRTCHESWSIWLLLEPTKWLTREIGATDSCQIETIQNHLRTHWSRFTYQLLALQDSISYHLCMVFPPA